MYEAVQRLVDGFGSVFGPGVMLTQLGMTVVVVRARGDGLQVRQRTADLHWRRRAKMRARLLRSGAAGRTRSGKDLTVRYAAQRRGASQDAQDRIAERLNVRARRVGGLCLVF